MANRAGRQAVLARTIIDATDRGTVARLAGARFRPYPAGTHTFRRVVVGGEPVDADGPGVRGVESDDRQERLPSRRPSRSLRGRPARGGFAGDPPGFVAYACVCGFPGWCEICIGESPLRGHAIRYGNRRGPVLHGNDRLFKIIEYTLELPMPDGSFASLPLRIRRRER
jgi:hypothetical protein